jgi:hypothetical protein
VAGRYSIFVHTRSRRKREHLKKLLIPEITPHKNTKMDPPSLKLVVDKISTNPKLLYYKITKQQHGNRFKIAIFITLKLLST